MRDVWTTVIMIRTHNKPCAILQRSHWLTEQGLTSAPTQYRVQLSMLLAHWAESKRHKTSETAHSTVNCMSHQYQSWARNIVFCWKGTILYHL